MSYGTGSRRRCPNCGQSVEHMREVLANQEVRGPRGITSSDIDRAYDDNGQRFLLIEEKGPDEEVPTGQWRMLRSLAAIPCIDVWGVRGTPERLDVFGIYADGPKKLLCEGGDISTYQSQVEAWFNAGPGADWWERWLGVIGGAIYDAPAWCPSEVWQAFDSALTAVMVARNRSEAS